MGLSTRQRREERGRDRPEIAGSRVKRPNAWARPNKPVAICQDDPGAPTVKLAPRRDWPGNFDRVVGMGRGALMAWRRRSPGQFSLWPMTPGRKSVQGSSFLPPSDLVCPRSSRAMPDMDDLRVITVDNPIDDIRVGCDGEPMRRSSSGGITAARKLFDCLDGALQRAFHVTGTLGAFCVNVVENLGEVALRPSRVADGHKP